MIYAAIKMEQETQWTGADRTWSFITPHTHCRSCTHSALMPWMSNTSSFQMLWLIILQHSRLKSSFRGPRVCLVDCDPLSIFPGATLVCPGDTESRTRPDLQQSENKPLSSMAPWMMCADRNLAGAAICFQVCSREEDLKHPNLISPSLLLSTAVFCP